MTPLKTLKGICSIGYQLEGYLTSESCLQLGHGDIAYSGWWQWSVPVRRWIDHSGRRPGSGVPGRRPSVKPCSSLRPSWRQQQPLPNSNWQCNQCQHGPSQSNFQWVSMRLSGAPVAICRALPVSIAATEECPTNWISPRSPWLPPFPNKTHG